MLFQQFNQSELPPIIVINKLTIQGTKNTNNAYINLLINIVLVSLIFFSSPEIIPLSISIVPQIIKIIGTTIWKIVNLPYQRVFYREVEATCICDG